MNSLIDEIWKASHPELARHYYKNDEPKKELSPEHDLITSLLLIKRSKLDNLDTNIKRKSVRPRLQSIGRFSRHAMTDYETNTPLFPPIGGKNEFKPYSVKCVPAFPLMDN